MAEEKESNCGLVSGLILLAAITIGVVYYYEDYLPSLKKKDEEGNDKTAKKDGDKTEPSLTKEEIKNAPQAEVVKQIKEAADGFGKGEAIADKPASEPDSQPKPKEEVKPKDKPNLSADGRRVKKKKKFNNDWGDIHF